MPAEKYFKQKESRNCFLQSSTMTGSISESMKLQGNLLKHEYKLQARNVHQKRALKARRRTIEQELDDDLTLPSITERTRNSASAFDVNVKAAIESLKNRSKNRQRQNELMTSSLDSLKLTARTQDKHNSSTFRLQPVDVVMKDNSLCLDASFVLNSHRIAPTTTFNHQREQTKNRKDSITKGGIDTAQSSIFDADKTKYKNYFRNTISPKHYKPMLDTRQSSILKQPSTTSYRFTEPQNKIKHEKEEGLLGMTQVFEPKMSILDPMLSKTAMKTKLDWQLDRTYSKCGPNIELAPIRFNELPPKVEIKTENQADFHMTAKDLRKSKSSRNLLPVKIPFRDIQGWSMPSQQLIPKNAQVDHHRTSKLLKIRTKNFERQDIAKVHQRAKIFHQIQREEKESSTLGQKSSIQVNGFIQSVYNVNSKQEDDEFEFIDTAIQKSKQLFDSKDIESGSNYGNSQVNVKSYKKLNQRWVDKHFKQHCSVTQQKIQKEKIAKEIKRLTEKKQETFIQEEHKEKQKQHFQNAVKSQFLITQQQKRQKEQQLMNKGREEIKRINDQKFKIVPMIDQAGEAEPQEEFKLEDTYTYHEKNAKYAIISNRLMILSQKNEKYPNMRQFTHWSIQNYKELYNPMRVKLRILPQKRAGLIQPGKNPKYYFLVAARFSLRNEYALAIEYLNKGLALDSTNLLCRFNHGAIAFKLGLIIEATNDFQMISAIYKKELAGHFNYALCLYQQGSYKEAKDTLELIVNQVKHKNQDLDAFHHFAVLKSQLKEKKKRSNKRQLFKFNQLSFDFELIQDTFFLMAFCNWQLINPKECISNLILAKRLAGWEDVMNQDADIDDDVQIYAEFRDLTIQEFGMDIFMAQASYRPLRSKSVQLEFDEENEFGRDATKASLNLIKNNQRKTKSYNKLRQNFDLPSHTNHSDLKSSFQDSSAEPESTHQEHEQYKHEQQFLLLNQKDKEHKKHNKHFKDQLIKKQQHLHDIEHETYHELRRQQIAVIDRGYFDIRFYKAYAHLLKPIAYTIQNMKLKLLKQTTNLNAQKRRNRYEDSSDEEHDLTPTEELFVKHRLELEEYTKQSHVNDIIEMPLAQILNQLGVRLIQRHTEGADVVRDKEVKGVHFDENNLMSVLEDQNTMVKFMKKIRQNVDHQTEEKIEEIKKESKSIKQFSLLDVDKLQRENATMQEKSEYNLGQKFIQDLKKSLNSSSEMPEEVEKILEDYLKEREKYKDYLENAEQEQKCRKRLTYKQTNLIHKEFTYRVGNTRCVQVLEKMLGTLKYIKNYQLHERNMLIREAKYLRLPGLTSIFKQGDLEDNMYVIVKGRVACEMASPQYGNLPIVFQVLADGESFGQITYRAMGSNEMRTREYSALTTESTDLLVINKVLIHKLQFTNSIDNIISNKFAKTQRSAADNKIMQKLEFINQDQSVKQHFLKHLPQFAKIDNESFIAHISKKIKKVEYKYGDQIILQNTVPEVFHIVAFGQCKVILKNIGERKVIESPNVFQLHYNHPINNHNYTFQKQDPIFNNYDPETSPLKTINFNHKDYQNKRIVIDKKGERIKKNITYQDQFMFQQLKAGDTFSGRILVPYKFYPLIIEQQYGQWAVERKYPKGTSKQELERISQFAPKKFEQELQVLRQKSLFTVLADSANVEIWTLDRQSLIEACIDAKITEDAQKILYSDIMACPDADRGRYYDPDIEYIRKLFIKWDNYKQNQSLPIFKSKIDSRTQGSRMK